MKSAVGTRPEERAGRRHTSPIGRFLIKLGSVGIVATLIHASSYHRTLVVVCLAKRFILRIVKRRLRSARTFIHRADGCSKRLKYSHKINKKNERIKIIYSKLNKDITVRIQV